MSTDDADTTEDAGKAEATAEATSTEKSVTEPVTEAEAAPVELEKARAKTPDEPKDTPASPDKSAAPRAITTPIIAAFLAGILLVAAVTAIVVFYLQAQKRGDEIAAVDQSTRAACAFGRTVSTYDYSKDLDGYFNTVKAGATGDFRSEFDDATKALTDAMVEAKVKSQADDVQCGYQSGDTDTAKVLVTLTQVRVNFTTTTPERQYIVVIADLRNEDGAWKVSKLDSPMLKGSTTGLPGGEGVPAPGAAPAPAPAPTPGG